MADNYDIIDAHAAQIAFKTTETASVHTPHHILAGLDDSGAVRPLAMTAEGHAEVAIHSPRLPFGSIHAERLSPIFQCDAVYGVDPQQVTATMALSGTATTASSEFVATTGTTIYGYGVIQSRKRLRYRPGQGVVGRFTARFTAGVASSLQVAGFGHAEDGFYYGFNGTSFGILYSRHGSREIQVVTITTASTAANSYQVTLNGVSHTVTATNNGTTAATAKEIAAGTYSGWTAQAVGSTVIFVRGSAGTAAGSYSVAQSGAGTPAAGTFSQTRAGAAATETWYPQASWNGDKLDGTGASGMTIDPTKGNVFQIAIQYLGYGSIVFSVETSPEGNNPDFIVAHTLALPNTLTGTNVSNPAFPFTMAAYSAGSTTDVAVRSASFAGFIEGEKVLHGNRMSYQGTSTSVGSANYQALFSVRNRTSYNGRANQSVVNILSIFAALKHTQPGTFFLIRGGTLGGTPNWTQFSTTSVTDWDVAGTTVTIADNSQIVWSGPLGETGQLNGIFGTGQEGDITLQPGEWITLAAKTATGTASYAQASLNTREDQ